MMSMNGHVLSKVLLEKQVVMILEIMKPIRLLKIAMSTRISKAVSGTK